MKLGIPPLIALSVTAAVVSAHTYQIVEETCPLCEESFECEMDTSGFQAGMRLDLKPLGPTPAPWSVPVCPQCHFVLYSDDISPEELTACQAIVRSDAYRQNSARASYYLLGLLFEGLDKDPLSLGHIFLQASWQEEADEDKLKDALERSLHHFERFLNRPRNGTAASQGVSTDDESYATAQLVKGEILRRLGRFDEAKAHFSDLRELEAFHEPFLAGIVRFQMRLCTRMDSGPYALSEMGNGIPNASAVWGGVFIVLAAVVVLWKCGFLRRRKRRRG